MGAPISATEKLDATKMLHSNIVESWGNTESLGTITDPEDIKSRPASIGRPFVTDELFIVDENLKFCKPGKMGRVAGGAEAGFIRYSNRPRETRRVRKRKLIVSEDIGYIDKDGYFYLVGRVQDMVVRGNKTVFLSAIESKLARALPARIILVVALGKEKTRVELIGLTTRNSATDISAMLVKINKALNIEEQISQLLVVDQIPKLASGKIDRVRLGHLAERLLNG
jgi:long-chain acyl-CoA synthetase